MFENYLQALGGPTRGAVSGFYGYGTPSNIFRSPDGSVNFSAAGGNPYAGINPYQYSNLSSTEMPADQLYADLIRAQTADYMNRFAPVENFLASEITATGTQALAGDLERTRGAIMGAGVNVQGQADRGMERYGLTNNADIANSNSQVSALVGGLNDTRLRDIDRRQMLLTGGLGGITQQARNIGQS
jgi:hypothetical protein